MAHAPDRDDVLGSLAERVRTLRAGAGMTQEQLARDSHVGLRMVQKIEAGDGNPSVLKLVGLARAMNVDPSELISGM